MTLDPNFSPSHLLACSTDRLVPAAAFAALADADAEWHRLHGGAAAASPVRPPSRGGADPVGRMARDIADLYRDHDECVTQDYLVALGWTPDELAQHGTEARATAARLLDQEEAPELAARPRVRRAAGGRRLAA